MGGGRDLFLIVVFFETRLDDAATEVKRMRHYGCTQYTAGLIEAEVVLVERTKSQRRRQLNLPSAFD